MDACNSFILKEMLKAVKNSAIFSCNKIVKSWYYYCNFI